jgi:hypothetical protein
MTPEPKPSSAFVDRWARYALLAPLVAALILLVTLPLERKILDDTARFEESYRSAPFRLEPSLIGATRVDVRVTLDDNAWAAVQLGLLDESGEHLADVVKEVWRESGVWAEEGETGTWAEADLDATWDTRLPAAETVAIEVELLDTGYTDGRVDADFPVLVRVRVTTGVVDRRFLFVGLGASLLLAILALYLGGHGGRPVIVEKVLDHQATGRAECGGPGTLVSVGVFSLLDETTPPTITLRVSVRDARGDVVYEILEGLAPKFVHDEGKVDAARVERHLYLVLPERESYGFTATVEPDGPVDWTKLVVRDRASTRGAVPVVTVPPKEAS